MKGKRNGFWKTSVFAILFAVLAFVSIGCASADMIYVPECGNRTIQQAVDNATEGDTIIVRDGTYNENVNVNVAHLTIRSQNGTANCIVNASDSGDHVFEVTKDYVNISGFTVENATGSGDEAGIYLDSGVGYCNISDNFASNSNCGIYLSSSSNNNLISNIASDNNCGIYLNSSSNNTLMSNIASDNNHGIGLPYSNNNTLMSNTANSNNYCGIILSFSSNNNLTSNTVNSNNYDGIYLDSSSNNTLTGNTVSDNDYGIKLEDSSNNTLYCNNLISNTEHDAYDTSINQWNTSSKGNYYSKYTGSDNNSDGIGDKPYEIPGGSSIDYFPLMQPFEEPALKGDLDDDDKITSKDAAIALQIAVGSRPFESAADMNGDGRVTSLDALIILQMAAGAC